MRHFQRFRILDQDAVTGGHPRAGHDGRRRGQAQRARAGDDQHGHGIDDGIFQLAGREPPAQHGQQRQHQHHGNKNRADLVDQMLDGRLGRLRVFHQTDDARQGRLATHGLRAYQQQTIGIDGAARDLVAHVLVDRQAFSRDQRLVDLAGAFHHHAIDGHPFPRADDDQVAHFHLLHGQVDFDAVATHAGRFRTQDLQGADGRGRLALGAAFQPFAQQHQGDDDG